MNEQLDRIELKMAELEAKVDLAYAAAEKTRKYLFWTGVVTVVVIIVPLAIIPFVLPSFLAAESASLPAGF